VIDYALGYRNLCQSSTEAKLFFIQNQIKSYPLLEKLLGFQRELNNLLFPVYNKILDNIEEPKNINITDQQLMEMSVSTLFSLNINTIFNALQILETNSIHDCGNMMRPVYESIPKMFYLISHPENTFLILLKEEFGLWITQEKYRDEANGKEILDDIEYFKNYLNHESEGQKQQERLKINVSKTFYNDKFKGRFNNEWYRKKIYTDESLKMQDTTYASLSQSSHANITRSRVEIKYDPILSPRFFKILTDFSFFNLYCFF